MGRTRFTTAEVQKIFESEGYTVVGEYVNSNTKIHVICPNNHDYFPTLGNFRSGYRCGACFGSVKYSHDRIATICKKEGYAVLGSTNGSHSRVTLTCPKGHIWNTVFTSFLAGCRCRTCGGLNKHTQEEIRALLANAGYALLSKYRGLKHKLEVMCPAGHITKNLLTTLKRTDFGCSACARNLRYTQEQVDSIFSAVGYKNLEEYKGINESTLVECPKRHRYTTTVYNFKNGARCKECSGRNKKSQGQVESIYSSKGYTVLDQYLGANKPLLVQCPGGHRYRSRLGHFTRGHGCKLCSMIGVSTAELHLFDAISRVHPSSIKLQDKVKIEGKPYIKGFHIDIFVPELKKGIEFDGDYYHSYDGLKRSRASWPDEDIHNYHDIKDEWFLSKGIEILHIKEGDWMKDKGAQLKRCLEFLNGVPPQELL